jgi:hypothetical protein
VESRPDAFRTGARGARRTLPPLPQRRGSLLLGSGRTLSCRNRPQPAMTLLGAVRPHAIMSVFGADTVVPTSAARPSARVTSFSGSDSACPALMDLVDEAATGCPTPNSSSDCFGHHSVSRGCGWPRRTPNPSEVSDTMSFVASKVGRVGSAAAGCSPRASARRAMRLRPGRHIEDGRCGLGS